jgi:hypothetical protein
MDPAAGTRAAMPVIDRLCARVYLGLREGRLVAEDVVELACALLEWGHGGQSVRDAVERDPGQVPPSELAGLAAGILEEAGFEPGFDLAPQRLAVLRRALRIVARDLPTAGIDGEPYLVILEGLGSAAAGVRLADGRVLTGGAELSGLVGEDLPGAVAAMADHVQSGLLERTWKVWPQCAGHRLGVHSVERRGVALWWCSGGGGHPVAPVGALPRPGATTRM